MVQAVCLSGGGAKEIGREEERGDLGGWESGCFAQLGSDGGFGLIVERDSSGFAESGLVRV